MLPSAHSILWCLGTLLTLWGASLLWRGLVRTRRRARRRCPACARFDPEGPRCPDCGFEPHDEREWYAWGRDWRLAAAGLVLAAFGIAAFAAGDVVRRWSTQTGELGFSADDFDAPAWDAAAAGVAIFGVALAVWGFRGDRSRGRRRCPRCWYDMTGAALVCPECGHDAQHASRLYRPRRRKTVIAVGAALLASSGAVHEVSMYRLGGWPALVPATATIALLPWVPDALVWAPRPVSDDWTLTGRESEHHLAAWQADWLHARALHIASTTRSVWVLRRSLRCTNDANRGQVMHGVRVSAERLCRGSSSEASCAAECLAALLESVDLPRPGPDQPIDFDSLLADLVPDLRRMVGDPATAQDVVDGAMAVLLECHQTVPSCIPELLGTLKRGPTFWRRTNAVMLGFATRENPGLFAPLHTAAFSRDPEESAAAIIGLRVSKAALVENDYERLFELVEAGAGPQSEAAASLLMRQGWQRRRVLAAIVTLVESDPARANLLGWLAEGGTVATPFLPRLARLLNSEDTRVRLQATEALDNLAQAGAFELNRSMVYPILIDLRDHDPDPKVQQAASAAILAIKPARLHPSGPSLFRPPPP